MTPAARLAASIDLLAAIQADPRPADATANAFFRDRRYIGSGDRRAVADRAWTVLRQYRRLAWWLARAGAAPTPRLLAAASLALAGWTPEGIAQSFSGGRFAPAPLNGAEHAALHAVAGHTLEHPDMPEPVRHEIPDFLLEPFRARFGAALAREMHALLEAAPLDLRANTLRTTRDGARAALAEEGIAAEPTPLSPWGLRVAGRRPVTTGPAFQSGLVEIQDEGSQLVALAAGAAPGMRVCDYCAGAGGKTLALAAAMENRGHLVACDVHDKRLESAVRRLRRAGVHNVERHLLAPGDRWAKRHAGSFDRVLVDAPCSGTGTWRRNPDARTRLHPEDVAELTAKQAAILAAAAPLVRPGGALIYATCSLLPEENEAQVETLLATNPAFTPRKPEAAWAGPGDFMALTPARHGTDGFFVAVLHRAPGA